ncbi:hypothetical protein ACJ73_00102 [Blastomyces percursus]|uniref:Uncharacterized protein n=1 Tax=Blastomyces percursus TaxID=1658174 RepID=A0A1J9RIZ8_9EURO|nr:hypothetical protein ACJ73_00102 [Blastomyces percursus]
MSLKQHINPIKSSRLGERRHAEFSAILRSLLSSILHCFFENILLNSNVSGSKVFLRKLPCGLNLYYRATATDGAWRQVYTNTDYFSFTVGNRVDAEAARHIAQVQAKTGNAPVDAVIEDPFHDSPSDQYNHAGVVYEDGNGNHLTKKHVTEKPEEQALVSLLYVRLFLIHLLTPH